MCDIDCHLAWFLWIAAIDDYRASVDNFYILLMFMLCLFCLEIRRKKLVNLKSLMHSHHLNLVGVGDKLQHGLIVKRTNELESSPEIKKTLGETSLLNLCSQLVGHQ